jgi:hypothetical protein
MSWTDKVLPRLWRALGSIRWDGQGKTFFKIEPNYGSAWIALLASKQAGHHAAIV